MTILKNLTRASLLLVVLLTGSIPSLAQQKRTPPAKSQQRAPSAVQPVPTFDTLLAADSYRIYGEIRGVGQVIRSSSVNELLEPIMKLAGPAKEFKTLVKWLNTHADAVMTSRMMVAGWSNSTKLPDMLVAIEFAAPEEAAKFAPQLNEFLPKVLPTVSPESEQTPGAGKIEAQDQKPGPTSQPRPPAPPKTNYHLKQVGSLLIITNTPFTLKNLRPAGSKLLSEEPNFRIIHDRFNSEAVFVYVDVKGIEKEDEERRQQFEEEQKRREAGAAERAEKEKTKDSGSESGAAAFDPAPEEPPAPMPEASGSQQNPQTVTATVGTVPQKQVQATEPDPMAAALVTLAPAFFNGEPKWPEAIGVAIAFDANSFDVRALLVNAPDVKGVAVPFVPQLISGPAIIPESPSILPSDTELFVAMSLDLPQMYAGMLKANPRQYGPYGVPQAVKETERESPFAPLEKKLGIKLKDDVLPLLGNEVVFSMPVKALQPGRPVPEASPNQNATKDGPEAPVQPAVFSPIVAISLRDKEAVRLLLPKIIDAWGVKGASGLAQSEKREDTEIVSYANVLSYAFMGNFLVLSPDVGTTRHVVDSYLKHETLSADVQFKNYTRWQPRQLQGQVYLSPALMESYKTWANGPSELISDQTREFLQRLSVVPEPVTYSLSNEGLGPLHELHVPKNLLLLAIAGISGEANQSPLITNERAARSTLSWIAGAEMQFYSGKGAGTYATLDQLVAETLIPKEAVENVEKYGYKLDLTVTGTAFEISAVPLEYGKTGKTSYFVDASNVVRGGDHGGGPATIADKPMP